MGHPNQFMAEKRKLEFFLLRYVPDAVKGEFVNFGLAVIEAPESGGGFADVRFVRDWRSVQRIDPGADIEMLEAIEGDLRKRVAASRNCEEIIKVLQDSFSNAIQVSSSAGCLSEDPAKEIEVMARMYLEPLPASAGERALTGRQKIVATMTEAWRSGGLADLVKAVPIAPYTGAGDPFVFDFGYRTGNEMKLFHALSLKARVDAAVTLAARYPKIAEAMRMAKGGPLAAVLTAVVDDDLDRKKEEIGFALGMMRENAIRVAEVREMARIVEAARKELGV